MIQPTKKDRGCIRFELDSDNKRVKMMDAKDLLHRLNEKKAGDELREYHKRLWYVTIWPHMCTTKLVAFGDHVPWQQG